MMVRLLNGDLVGTDALAEDLDDTVEDARDPVAAAEAILRAR